MLFYRYIFFKVYSFFEKLKSKNVYNVAIGILSVSSGHLIYKVHSFVSKQFYHHSLKYDEIAIPYIVVCIIIIAINYFLLRRNPKYYEAENIFKRKDQPKSYGLLLIMVVIAMLAIFIFL
jgi:hypothetical protein